MNATTPSMAEEAGNATLVDDNRAHSNGRSRENKYSDVTFLIEGGGCLKKPLCNGGR